MALADTAKLLASLELKDNFSKGIRQAEGSLNRFEKRLGRVSGHVSRGIGNAARNIERLAVVGIGGATAAMTYSVAKAIEWESAVAGVNKTLDATPDELKQITDGLIRMSTRTPTAAADLAAIAEAAGALGIAKDDVLAFTETVSLIGTTTDVSVDEAATALGQLGNVLKLTGEDYDNFASALVDLGNKGASTESQILEITRRAGGSAKLVGIAKDATLGWSSAVANLGVNAELGGTGLQNFFLKSMPLFTQGNKTLQKITGQTAAQLKRSFSKDASGALEDFLVKLGRMPKDSRLKAVQTLFGKGSGLTRIVLGLADSMDTNLAPALDTASEAWQKNTAAAEEAEKRYQTTESQLAILRNNVDSAAITIGSKLLPLINELGQEFVTWLQAHQGDIERFGTDLANGVRDAVKWAKSLDWGSITRALQTAAGFAKDLVTAFLGMPTWVQTAVISGWGLNKLTGGALGGIVGELAKGLIKGVLGITAGIVNVTAAKVVGGGGLPTATAPAAGSATAAAGVGLGGLAAAVAVGTAGALSQHQFNVMLDEHQLSEFKQSMGPSLFDPIKGLENAVKAVEFAIEGFERSQDANSNKETGTTRSTSQATRQAVLATNAVISRGTATTARNLDQVESAIERKKLSVRFNVRQAQRQAIQASISGTAQREGKKGFQYTSDKSQTIDYSRLLAGGAVGVASTATPAIFGEAGREAFAILRNPRKGMLGGAPPIVNVTVNIDPRRVTKKQTSSGIYKTFVST